MPLTCQAVTSSEDVSKGEGDLPFKTGPKFYKGVCKIPNLNNKDANQDPDWTYPVAPQPGSASASCCF